MSQEPTQESVAREFPGWRTWTGVKGQCYAQTVKASPPVTLRGSTWADVHRQLDGRRQAAAR